MSSSSPGNNHTRRYVWAMGGGKGGVGRTVLAAALGWELGRMGRRVILVDADACGVNLHSCMGLDCPEWTLNDFVARRCDNLGDCVISTGFPGVRLISGAAEFLDAANIRRTQKLRVLQQIRDLDCDVVLIDLGAAGSASSLDMCLLADRALVVVAPEPTAFESAYRFLKALAYRRLGATMTSPGVRSFLERAVDDERHSGLRTPLDLARAVELEEPRAVGTLKKTLESIQPWLVVNQVRGEADQLCGHQMALVCARVLGIPARYAGWVRYDESVWQGVRRRRLFSAEVPNAPAADDVRQLARTLLSGKGLAMEW